MSSGSFSSVLSVLGHHIRDVFFLGSKKKMSWINAWRIVTAMKNLHSFRYGSVAKNPRGSACKDGYAFTGRYGAVSASVYTPRPFPTRIGVVNLGPEPVWKSGREAVRSEYRVWVEWNLLGFLLAKLGWCSNIFLHRSVGLICAAPPDRQIAEAISL